MVFKNLIGISLLPKTIWAMGMVTLLMNMSTVIIFSLSPLYLTSALGVSVASVGMLEGLVESLAWFTRLFSGVMSDFLHKRKPILLVAYGFTVISRPLFALADGVMSVFFSRSLDRIGNGLQATPREALVGDAAPKMLKGASFGLRQALSVMGSMLGAFLVYVWSKQPSFSYQSIFWFATIPPLLGFMILVFCVTDSVHEKLQKKRENLKTIFSRWAHLSPGYWRVIAVAFVFMVSNYSGAFLILRVTEGTQNLRLAALTMVFQNLASMVCAYPAGRLSDMMDRRWLLAFGFTLTIASNMCLAQGGGLFWGLIGATLWGAQLGVVQSLLMTKIADHTSQDLRATAFGVYYVLIAFAVLLGNKIMGYFYDHHGASWGFYASGLFALWALGVLPFLKSPQILKHH